MKKGRYNTLAGLVIIAFPLLFLSLFYIFPLMSIFKLSFFSDGGFNVDIFKKLFSKNYYYRVFYFTFFQALLSTFVTVAAALPGAYIYTHYSFPGKKLLKTVTTIPFVLPTVVVAAAFQAFLGKKGVINQVYASFSGGSGVLIHLDQTLWLIILAHLFFNYTIVFRIVSGFWAQLGNKTAEAAKMLGASGFKIFIKITLPLLKPALYASSLLVFIFCFSSFGVILILGGPKFSTVETEIYKQAVYLFNLPMASVLSIIQIFFTFLFMWLYSSIQKKACVELMGDFSVNPGKKAVGWFEKTALILNYGFVLLFIILPIASLFIKSVFSAQGFTFSNYTGLFENKLDSIFFVSPNKAILFSFIFGLLTIIFALFIGVLASFGIEHFKNRLSVFFDSILMLPLTTSAVTLGFGFIIALDTPPLNLRNSFLLVPLAHTLVAYPFVLRSVLPALRSIPNSLREAAMVLGAKPGQVFFNIDLPMIKSALITAAVFAFTISMGEFGATSFTARPQIPTMPVAIYRYLGQPGAVNYGHAMAMSSLLILVTVSGFLIIEKLGKDK
ncbi:MAG: iron ABC transporter permease [Desulfobacteraceae bacterium]|nr:iron ABC transporter permease [Desulfobacteraceae bacterium]